MRNFNTLLGLGNLKGGGTWASCVAYIFIVLIFLSPSLISININPNFSIYSIFALTIFFTVYGIYTSDKHAKELGIKDPSIIVIDEVAGSFFTVSLFIIGYSQLLNFDPQFLILLSVEFSSVFLFITLVLFRIFDIFKPFPVSYFDQKVSGGMGIMLDDIAAGLMAALTFFILLMTSYYTGLLVEFVRLIHPDWVQ